MKTLVTFILVTISFITLIKAELSTVAANGDAFSIVRTVSGNDSLIYVLQRTSQKGEIAVLWQSAPQRLTQNSGLVPQPSVLSLSPITAICEEQNQISLLVLDGESDALVFRFNPLAKKLTPVRINNVMRAGDPPGELRFRHHGELIFGSPESSSEKLIRFDDEGNISQDFRATKGASEIVTLVSSGGSTDGPLDPSSISSKVNHPSPVQPAAAKKRAEANPKGQSQIKEPGSLTIWSIVFVLSVAAVVLLLKGKK